MYGGVVAYSTLAYFDIDWILLVSLRSKPIYIREKVTRTKWVEA